MKRPKTHFVFFVMCLSLSSPLFANSKPVGSTGDILFWMDSATFARTDSLAYVEIYLQLSCRDFDFSQKNDIQMAKYLASATLEDTLGKKTKYYDLLHMPQKTLKWQKVIQASQNIAIQNQVAIETLGFYTTPGHYTLKLTIDDVATSKKATCQMPLRVVQNSGALALSNIQMGRHIDKTYPTNRLLKNGFWIAPNVTRTLAPAQETLPVYFEIYGLAKGDQNAFDVAYALSDDQGRPIKMYSTTRYPKPGATSTLADSLALPELSPGAYTVQVTARDVDTRQLVKKQIDFWVSPPNTTTLSTDPISLTRYYEQIRYIATRQELSTYNTLSATEKVQFILKFWKDKDPTPHTPENEFAAEHFRRIKYADQTFASRPKQKGSDTDKGRVYIQYGPPTDIERNYFNAIGKDYEIWTYEHINYYQFIFLDRLGDSVLELVHATMPGERRNPHWKDQQIIGNPSDPMAPPTEAFQNVSQSSP